MNNWVINKEGLYEEMIETLISHGIDRNDAELNAALNIGSLACEMMYVMYGFCNELAERYRDGEDEDE